MQDATHTALSVWESFYVIVGSSGAGLTGLQFVVMALVAETDTRSSTREIDAFGTPTIVHFCTVLLLSAILSVPWQAIVVRRARRTTEYKPVLEDWLWHTIFPLTCHTALVAAAIALSRGMAGALFVIAAVCLCLLFIGIHNAWDTVVYIAIERPPKARRGT
jgi:hypothetical protein